MCFAVVMRPLSDLATKVQVAAGVLFWVDKVWCGKDIVRKLVVSDLVLVT